VWAWLGASALLVTLAGCGSPGGNWSAGSSATGRGNDISTASDESDARRRARIRLDLASTYFSQRQYTTALDEAKIAQSIDPTLVGVVELRALIYDAMGDQARAEEAFKQALSMESDNASVLHNYGWFECRRKAYDKADALLERAASVPLSPTKAKSLLARGVCQVQAGRWDDAEKSLMRSLEVDSANPATGYNLAAVLYHQGEFERARFHIRRVNAVPAQVTAESLWLAVRIEHKLGNAGGRDELGAQLRNRFTGSREATNFELGHFDD